MKVAYILPSLKNQGPIIVAKDIISGILDKVDTVDVYYFDDGVELDFPCNTEKISLFQKIDFNKYDIIHSHMLRADFYTWYHRKKHHTPKFISTLHQIIFDNLKGNYNTFIAFIFEKIWLLLLKKQDYIVYLTQTMLKTYENKVNTNNLVIYNGRDVSDEIINEAVEEEQKILEIKQKYKIIGTHCLLTKRKGVHQAIMALKHLTDYFLIVIGDGMERQNLQQLSINQGVDSRCMFVGYKKQSISYLKYFDVYIATSFSEGFSLSIIEAGLCKLPIVCSNIEAFTEPYTSDEVKFYNLNNINSLVQAIQVAYENKEKYATNIYEKVTKEYSIQNMSNNYLELYKKR